MDILTVLEDKAKGNLIFPSIRMRRARERVNRAKKPWNGRLKPSMLSFTGCPYNTFQNIDKEDEYIGYGDKDKNNYLAHASTTKHEEWQKELRSLNYEKDGVSLYSAPALEKIHESCRFKLTKEQLEGKQPLDTIELPFFYDGMMGFIDGIIKYKDNPIIGDFKNKQVPVKDTWKNLVKTMFPLDKDVAQLAIYKRAVNNLKYLDKKVEIVGVWYYNICLTGDLDAEYEFYLNPPEDVIEYMLDSYKEEMIRYKMKVESCCKYEYCAEHGSKRLFVRDWIVKV